MSHVLLHTTTLTNVFLWFAAKTGVYDKNCNGVRFDLCSVNSFSRLVECLCQFLFRPATVKLTLPTSQPLCKASQVTSYYLLPCLTVANEIPNVLIKQVGNLLLNEVAFSLFSPRQTKTKQQREAVQKGALVRWVTCCPLSLRYHQHHSADSIKPTGCLNTWQ